MTDSAPSLEHIEGQYEILQKLQEGGMGAIFKVRHRDSGETRVVKTVHPEHAADETLQRRFQREAEAATRLQHRNLARFFEFHVNDLGAGHMVLEFIDGLTLGELLQRRRPPSLGLALEIADQTLDGLAYLHGEGFVHRDVAPDNIMVTTTEDGGPLVKLIDLGVAKAEGAGGSLTRAGTFLGKVRYSAPEGFAGDSKQLTTRSDLYSFGVVLYELLTGSLPILGKNFSEIVSSHVFKAPLDFATSDPEGRVSPGLRQAVLAALVKDPKERTSSAEELRRRLALEHQGLLPEPGELAEILNATAPAPTLPSVQSLLSNARLLLQLQSHSEARRRLRQILTQEPDHEEARSLLDKMPDAPKAEAISIERPSVPVKPVSRPATKPATKPAVKPVLKPAPKPASEAALPESPADEAVIAVERSLRLGDLDQARKQLDLAISYYGDRPAYAKLEARLVCAEKDFSVSLDGETEPVETVSPGDADSTHRKSRMGMFLVAAVLLVLGVLAVVLFVL